MKQKWLKKHVSVKPLRNIIKIEFMVAGQKQHPAVLYIMFKDYLLYMKWGKTETRKYVILDTFCCLSSVSKHWNAKQQQLTLKLGVLKIIQHRGLVWWVTQIRQLFDHPTWSWRFIISKGHDTLTCHRTLKKIGPPLFSKIMKWIKNEYAKMKRGQRSQCFIVKGFCDYLTWCIWVQSRKFY